MKQGLLQVMKLAAGGVKVLGYQRVEGVLRAPRLGEPRVECGW